MQYSQNPDKVKEYSKEALDRIARDGLLAVPDIYELFYLYYAEMSPEITRAIDILESSGKDINTERALELHERYLSKSSETARVKNAGDEIQKTIQEVAGAVHGVATATNNYKHSLEVITAEIDEDPSPERVKGALETVMRDTQNMIAENEKLEKELAKSTAIMEELRKDLEMVKKQAMTDSLTNLANRKAFDLEMTKVRKMSDESGKAFSLVLMDIDHFKAFNDNYGHQVGDQVLRLVARTLIDGVKGRDTACRYGGEEFAIILPDTNVDAGLKVADYLRLAVAGKDLVNRATGEKLGTITLSAGVAEYYHGESIEALINRADEALYAAKEHGRNNVREAQG